MSPSPIPDGTQPAVQVFQALTKWNLEVPIISAMTYDTTDKTIYDDYIENGFCGMNERFRNLFPTAHCGCTGWGRFWDGFWTIITWAGIIFVGAVVSVLLGVLLGALGAFLSEKYGGRKSKAGKDVELAAYNPVPTNEDTGNDTGVPAADPTMPQMAQSSRTLPDTR